MKNSKEEENFIKEVLYVIKNIDISNLLDINKLEDAINSLTLSIENVWKMNSKYINITKHSKSW